MTTPICKVRTTPATRGYPSMVADEDPYFDGLYPADAIEPDDVLYFTHDDLGDGEYNLVFRAFFTGAPPIVSFNEPAIGLSTPAMKIQPKIYKIASQADLARTGINNLFVSDEIKNIQSLNDGVTDHIEPLTYQEYDPAAYGYFVEIDVDIQSVPYIVGSTNASGVLANLPGNFVRWASRVKNQTTTMQSGIFIATKIQPAATRNACLNNGITADIKNAIAYHDSASRYFDGEQANGLYGLDVFLNYYQNNINAGGNTDPAATATFVRNPNCWAYSFDLTCCSPWNMHPTLRLQGGGLQSSSNHMAGTLISPRHVIFCRHPENAPFHPPAGSLMRFVTKDNQTVTRTMTAITHVPSGDFAVGVLDSDVPPEITFARILPDNWKEKFSIDPYGQFTSDVFVAIINQDESIFARKWELLPNDDSVVTWPATVSVPPAFSRNVRSLDSGSPVLLFVGKKPIILSVATYANSGSSVWARRADINSVMAALGGGYTLTPMSLEPNEYCPAEPTGCPDFQKIGRAHV